MLVKRAFNKIINLVTLVTLVIFAILVILDKCPIKVVIALRPRACGRLRPLGSILDTHGHPRPVQAPLSRLLQLGVLCRCLRNTSGLRFGNRLDGGPPGAPP